MKTEKKAVLITGTSSGIGKACALHLDKLGYKVYAGIRKISDAEELKKIASAKLCPVIIDVTDESSIISIKEQLEREIVNYSSFALVNNAGIAKAGPIELQPLEELKQQMDVNLFGVVLVIQQFIPILRKYNGRIVNISSISGISSLPFKGTYSATKFALVAITDALRLELKPWKISVSNVLPSATQTPVWGKALTEADKMLKNWTKEAFQMYGPIVDMMKKIASKSHGIHPDNVAFAVAKLLNSKNPRTRVLVGKEANFLAFIEKLPTWLRDWIIFRQLPKYGHKE